MKYLTILFGIVLCFSCKPYEGAIQQVTKVKDIDYGVNVDYQLVFDEIEIAFVDTGSGENTLLFIHGLGSNLLAWKKNIEGLKDKYRCIAIDLPGYGKSSNGNYPYDMEFFASTVSEFIKKRQLEKVTLVGHSMGGQISMTLALHEPELVDNLVLVAPAGFETFHEGKKQWFRDVFTADLVKYTPVEAIQANLAYNFYTYPSEAEFMITDRIALRKADDFDRYCYAVVRSVNGMVDQPVFEFLEDIRQPTLVVFGENDNLIPNRFLNPGFTEVIAKQGVDKIPNAQLKMISKCGHFAQFEKADQVNSEIRNFIQP